MAKPNERKRQQKREQQKRKREQAKRRNQAQARADALPSSERALVELASAGEFGPAWVSEGWDDPARAGRLVSIIIMRRLRGRLVFGQLLTVDRSCLGIKYATLLDPIHEQELTEHVRVLAEAGPTLVRIDAAIAQSIVFHALDYAASLGFEPHRGFRRALVEPRPSELIETVGARPARPCYVPDDNDELPDVIDVLERLDKAVGLGNFDFTGPQAAKLASVVEVLLGHPPDLGLDPADTGGDPQRINWRAACEGIEWAEPLLVEDTAHSGELVMLVDDLIWQLESGYTRKWEAVLRHEQRLPLTAAQRDIVETLGADEKRVELIDRVPRPCEPWYHAFDRLLDELIFERPSTDEPIDDALFNCAPRLLDAVRAHAAELSLPPGVDSLADLLADERVSRIHVQRLFDAISGLGQRYGDQPISLADPEQHSRRAMLAKAYEREREHFERLGLSLPTWLRWVEMPDDERGRVLDAIRRKHPELLRALAEP